MSAKLTWRPIRGEDVASWNRMMTAAAEVDEPNEHLTEDDLSDMLVSPWRDQELDTLAGIDDAGEVRAAAVVDLRPGDASLLRAWCLGTVHPDWRGRGIGRTVLEWQLARAQDLVRERRAGGEPLVPGLACVGTDEHTVDRHRLARAAGMTPRRWFLVMQRDLTDPVPEVSLDAGLRLVPYSADLDEAIRHAHNEAFQDHWGSQPWTPEAWQQWETGHRDFRADWSFAVLDGDPHAGGDVAAYALSAGFPADWAAKGYTEGWTGKLGVRRGWRGRGLAKALLARSMQAFRASGMQFATLDVDAESLTGAVRLYEGLGYTVTRRTTLWALDL